MPEAGDVVFDGANLYRFVQLAEDRIYLETLNGSPRCYLLRSTPFYTVPPERVEELKKMVTDHGSAKTRLADMEGALPLAYEPPEDMEHRRLDQGSSSTEEIKLTIIRGDTGQEETYIKRGEVSLMGEDMEEIDERAKRLGLRPIG